MGRNHFINFFSSSITYLMLLLMCLSLSSCMENPLLSEPSGLNFDDEAMDSLPSIVSANIYLNNSAEKMLKISDSMDIEQGQLGPLSNIKVITNKAQGVYFELEGPIRESGVLSIAETDNLLSTFQSFPPGSYYLTLRATQWANGGGKTSPDTRLEFRILPTSVEEISIPTISNIYLLASGSIIREIPLLTGATFEQKDLGSASNFKVISRDAGGISFNLVGPVTSSGLCPVAQAGSLLPSNVTFIPGKYSLTLTPIQDADGERKQGASVKYEFTVNTNTVIPTPPTIEAVEIVLNGSAGPGIPLISGSQFFQRDLTSTANIKVTTKNAKAITYDLVGSTSVSGSTSSSPFQIFSSPRILAPSTYELEVFASENANGSGLKSVSRKISFTVNKDPTPIPTPTPTPTPTPGVQHTVNTLAEAIANTGLKEGDKIQVLGFHRANDGGGGIFELKNSGAVPARAFVYVPLSAQSSEKVFNRNINSSRDLYDVQLPLQSGQHLIPDTISWNISGTSIKETSWSIQIDDKYFHGTVANHDSRTNSTKNMINYATGQFELSSLSGGYLSDKIFYNPTTKKGWLKTEGHTAFWKYKHTTSNLRLHRISDSKGNNLPSSHQTWELRWWGLKSHAQSSYYDNSFEIGWATKQAQSANWIERNASRPLKVNRLLATNDRGPSGESIATTFYHWGTFLFPLEVTFEGEGGVLIKEETDKYGNKFKFARRSPKETLFKALPVEQTEYGYGQSLILRIDATADSIKRFGPPTKKYLVNSFTHNGTPEGQSGKFCPDFKATTLKNVSFHGNGESHYSALESLNLTNDEWNNNFRNAPTHTGFNGDYQGYRSPENEYSRIPVCNVVFDGVAITDFMATGVLHARGGRLLIRNGLLIGNTIFNHSFYVSAAVKADVITVEGYAWTHATPGGATVIDWLSRIDSKPNPSGRIGMLWGYRGPDQYDYVPDPASRTITRREVNSDQSVKETPYDEGALLIAPPAVHIKNLYNNSDNPTSFAAQGPNILVENLTRVGSREQVMSYSGNGYGKSAFAGVKFKNVKVFIENDTPFNNLFSYKGTSLVLDGFQATAVTDEGKGSTNAGWLFNNPSSGLAPAGEPRYNVIKNFASEDNPYRALHAIDLQPRSYISRLFLSNVHFTTTNGTFIQTKGHGGLMEKTATGYQFRLHPQYRDSTGVYLENSTGHFSSRYFGNDSSALVFARFRNCRDRYTNRYSETELNFTASAGQMSYESDSGLFWMPLFPYKDTKIFINGAARSVGAWGSGAQVEVRYKSPSGTILSDDRSYLTLSNEQLNDADNAVAHENRQKPIIELRFKTPLVSGDRVRIEAAVSPWEPGVEVPAAIPPRFPAWLYPFNVQGMDPEWSN